MYASPRTGNLPDLGYTVSCLLAYPGVGSFSQFDKKVNCLPIHFLAHLTVVWNRMEQTRTVDCGHECSGMVPPLAEREGPKVYNIPYCIHSIGLLSWDKEVNVLSPGTVQVMNSGIDLHLS